MHRKLGLIVIAGINILIFHAGVYRSVNEWNIDAETPWRAKTAGAISAVAWTLVIFAGRSLAYSDAEGHGRRSPRL